MKNTKKIVSIVIAVALVCTAAVAGTLAYLSQKSDVVKNTFTVGNINLTLAETKQDFKMVPGNTIDKDPILTVKADSEACYLFVKVDKSTNFDSFMTYDMADGWTALPNNDGVFYRLVDATTQDAAFNVIKNDKVAVKDSVNKTMMDALTDSTLPTLTFTGYAVQQANIATPELAYAEAIK